MDKMKTWDKGILMVLAITNLIWIIIFLFAFFNNNQVLIDINSLHEAIPELIIIIVMAIISIPTLIRLYKEKQ